MSSSHALKMRLAPWALLLVSASWGLAFVVMKDAIERQSVNSFLFTRFLVAVIAMFLLKPTVIQSINREVLRKGFIAGLFLAAGYILQTLGLALTGAAVTGFITGLYVVATPVIAALVLRVRITAFTWGCVLLATVGLALLSLKGWNLGYGEFLVFLCAIAFAAHIIALSKWSNGLDVYAMTIVQLTTCALATGVISLIQGYEAPPDRNGWYVVLFTAIICTAVAFVVQTWSQAHMSATKVAVILTMEVVFAALFAVVFGGESLSLRTLFGGVLVFAAMFMIVLKEA
ncbi:DMT family transporter [Candidatus Planktophila versatilis]|uniref:EamA-like transporter family protein n=1 Tax=Candidatus Planktophila versatilis TaxID=1884905 RepID=A0ABN5BDI3_9ACTN|nr:DMT family transporter [Candidatus Planktophila versatilis]ASY17101.1 EamA-like transporter family protein [Candidatus Planktophila versatilis]